MIAKWTLTCRTFVLGILNVGGKRKRGSELVIPHIQPVLKDRRKCKTADMILYGQLVTAFYQYSVLHIHIFKTNNTHNRT